MKIEELQNNIIIQNTPLAYKVAWTFRGCGIDQSDLQGIALLALVKAASVFDESRGVKFSTFAVPVMQNEIRMELRRHRRNRCTDSIDAEISFSNKSVEGITLLEFLSYEEKGFEKVEIAETLPQLLSLAGLREKERQSITMVICREMKQKDAADLLGITQSQVSRCVKHGIEKLRKAYTG